MGSWDLLDSRVVQYCPSWRFSLMEPSWNGIVQTIVKHPATGDHLCSQATNHAPCVAFELENGFPTGTPVRKRAVSHFASKVQNYSAATWLRQNFKMRRRMSKTCMFTRILLMQWQWIQSILNGEKSWEIRHCNTTKRETIALGRKGLAYGLVDIIDSFETDYDKLSEHHGLHQHPDPQQLGYARPHVWKLANPRWFAEPRPYVHKDGAQGFVIYKPPESTAASSELVPSDAASSESVPSAAASAEADVDPQTPRGPKAKRDMSSADKGSEPARKRGRVASPAEMQVCAPDTLKTRFTPEELARLKELARRLGKGGGLGERVDACVACGQEKCDVKWPLRDDLPEGGWCYACKQACHKKLDCPAHYVALMSVAGALHVVRRASVAFRANMKTPDKCACKACKAKAA
eukprot:CAMPEP_0197628958 /NCGR_PEP_ID=MMETSP1338-20131121/7026_1 /TAXON_ID=43686 ORGANISM="Pelagodinium beii, Strain RCC1491" /NCGR_SAMPLE_ID=MMETSP1338 /ASSEMBLY_ACC=CAM_ASM_000754 /LENGTH=405 /DNA_ID=CAMNT_0043199963 /DNA_START=395 /DNA_END=1612 /DNA_ORIENTATION=+